MIVKSHDTVRRTVKAVRLTALNAIAGLSVVLVSGCTANAGSEIPPGWMGPEEYQTEYSQVIAEFPEPMPPGVEFPLSPAPLTGMAEVSVGEAQAYFIWACAWQDVILNSEDPELKAEAVAQIRGFASTSWAKAHYLDPDGVWINMADKAALGDVTEVRSSFAGDCSHYVKTRDAE